MKCARCGAELTYSSTLIGENGVKWWSPDVSTRLANRGNGYYCDGNSFGNQHHIPFSFRDYINLLKNRVVHLDINSKDNTIERKNLKT